MRLLAIFVFFAALGQSASGQEMQASPAPLMPAESKQAAPGELPDDVISLRRLAGEYYYTGNSSQFVEVMEKLHLMRPYKGEYMYQLVIAYALSGQRTKAYNLMLNMQRQGLSYDFTETEDVANIRETQVFEYLNDLMIRAGQPMGNGSIVFSLPEEFILPEAIAWDEQREKFIIGNVVEGRILLIDLEGNEQQFIQPDPSNGPWGVFDIKIDSVRNLLWVSSAASSAYKLASAEVRGSTGLFKFDLASGKLLGSYLVTDTDKARSALANMALASDGTVYVADSLRPIIYKLESGDDAPVPVFVSTDLISIRGLALSENDKTLYVADYELGVLVVHLEDKLAEGLFVPEKFNIGGIDGLYLWEKYMVIIQNGNTPQRVMRLELDPTGKQVSNVRPLEVAHPAFDAPNYGTIVEDDLYYFGNSQWHRMGRDGTLVGRKPVSVLKTSLLGGADLKSPELERIMEQIRGQSDQPRAKEG